MLAARDRGTCFRCGLAATEWHHRRSRRVRDEYTHSAGNGVSLCADCHRWAHGNPDHARALGFIVGRDVADPGTVPVRGYAGWQRLDHDGSITYLTSPPPMDNTLNLG